MNIIDVELDKIKPYPNNPRDNSGAVEVVATSLREFGFKQPIVVDKDYTIIVGHTRYFAATELSMATVPVLVASDLSEQQCNAYRIADNKTSEFAEWDIELLTAEFMDLAGCFTGFTDDEIAALIPDDLKTGLTDDDAVPDIPDEPISKLGDIYQLGNHRLMCGDSTDTDHVQKLINDKSIDMIFTDPPYGINEKGDRSGRKGEKSFSDGVKYHEFSDDTNQYAIDAYNVCENLNIKRQVWWGANYYCHALPQSNNWFIWDKRIEDKQRDLNSDCEMAWVKSEFSSIRIFRHLWKGLIKGSEHGVARVHPTQKPIALAEWAFNYFKNVQSVLDLFLGSGSTLIACEKTNRVCYGMELDPHYVDVIITRWQDFTGKEAVKIGSYNG